MNISRLGVLLLGVVVACASAPKQAGVEPGADAEHAVQPVVWGGTNGLELRWWVLREEADQSLASALAPYGHQPLPIDEQAEARCRASGLRLFRVPLADLPGLQRRLPLIGRVDRKWLGQTPRWREAARGAEFPAANLMLGDGEQVQLDAGTLRLLVRAWTAPGREGPRLRTDLAVQHEPSRRRSGSRLFASGSSERPVQTGVIFESTVLRMALAPGYAYLLAPADPKARWRRDQDRRDQRDEETASSAADDAGPASDQKNNEKTRHENGPPTEGDPTQPGDQLSDEGEPNERDRAPYGPPAARLPTVGEALLSNQVSLPGGKPVRAVILLIPRVPDRFTLLQ